MNKQLRILIGDIGDNFSISCAACFCAAQDWAVTRRQQHEILLREIRREHPDVLILNLTAPTMRFPELTAEVLRHSDLMILALYRVRNSGLELIFSQQGVRYMQIPDSMTELVSFVHRLAANRQPAQPAQNQEASEALAVTRLLHSFGISPNLRGFHYLRSAILFAYEQDTRGGCMMNTIYPAVAEAEQSTPARVERSIRHAILQAWENANDNAGWQFGIKENHRMTNSEFISFAVDWLRTEYAARRRYG